MNEDGRLSSQNEDLPMAHSDSSKYFSEAARHASDAATLSLVSALIAPNAIPSPTADGLCAMTSELLPHDQVQLAIQALTPTGVNEETLLWACDVLGGFLSEPSRAMDELMSLCAQLRDAQIVDRLCALICHESIELSSGALAVIANIAADATDPAGAGETRRRIRDAEGVKAILEQLQSGIPSVLFYATGALMNLCTTATDAKTIYEVGMMPRLIQLSHGPEPQLAQYATACLHNLQLAIVHTRMTDAVEGQRIASSAVAVGAAARGYLARRQAATLRKENFEKKIASDKEGCHSVAPKPLTSAALELAATDAPLKQSGLEPSLGPARPPKWIHSKAKTATRSQLVAAMTQLNSGDVEDVCTDSHGATSEETRDAPFDLATALVADALETKGKVPQEDPLGQSAHPLETLDASEKAAIRATHDHVAVDSVDSVDAAESSSEQKELSRNSHTENNLLSEWLSSALPTHEQLLDLRRAGASELKLVHKGTEVSLSLLPIPSHTGVEPAADTLLKEGSEASESVGPKLWNTTAGADGSPNALAAVTQESEATKAVRLVQAATTVQSGARAKRARRERQQRGLNRAAAKVQTKARAHLARTEVKQRRDAKHRSEMEAKAATTVQVGFRAQKARYQRKHLGESKAATTVQSGARALIARRNVECRRTEKHLAELTRSNLVKARVPDARLVLWQATEEALAEEAEARQAAEEALRHEMEASNAAHAALKDERAAKRTAEMALDQERSARLAVEKLVKQAESDAEQARVEAEQAVEKAIIARKQAEEQTWQATKQAAMVTERLKEQQRMMEEERKTRTDQSELQCIAPLDQCSGEAAGTSDTTHVANVEPSPASGRSADSERHRGDEASRVVVSKPGETQSTELAMAMRVIEEQRARISEVGALLSQLATAEKPNVASSMDVGAPQMARTYSTGRLKTPWSKPTFTEELVKSPTDTSQRDAPSKSPNAIAQQAASPRVLPSSSRNQVVKLNPAARQRRMPVPAEGFWIPVSDRIALRPASPATPMTTCKLPTIGDATPTLVPSNRRRSPRTAAWRPREPAQLASDEGSRLVRLVRSSDGILQNRAAWRESTFVVPTPPTSQRADVIAPKSVALALGVEVALHRELRSGNLLRKPMPPTEGMRASASPYHRPVRHRKLDR